MGRRDKRSLYYYIFEKVKKFQFLTFFYFYNVDYIKAIIFRGLLAFYVQFNDKNASLFSTDFYITIIA